MIQGNVSTNSIKVLSCICKWNSNTKFHGTSDRHVKCLNKLISICNSIIYCKGEMVAGLIKGQTYMKQYDFWPCFSTKKGWS